MSDKSLTVEVAYARVDRQEIILLQVAAGTTAAQAVWESGILHEFPDIDFADIKLGIFGVPTPRDTTLNAGDRVEIYRPLIADPKESRRRRAAAEKKTKKGR